MLTSTTLVFRQVTKTKWWVADKWPTSRLTCLKWTTNQWSKWCLTMSHPSQVGSRARCTRQTAGTSTWSAALTALSPMSHSSMMGSSQTITVLWITQIWAKSTTWCRPYLADQLVSSHSLIEAERNSITCLRIGLRRIEYSMIYSLTFTRLR